MQAPRFNPHASHPARAVQAWQILVGLARNRQTITYLELSRLMYGKAAQGVLNKILGHIAFYCIDHGLPILTTIVVGKGVGLPGSGIPADPAKLNKLREAAHNFEDEWFDVYPPSEEALKQAHDAHT